MSVSCLVNAKMLVAATFCWCAPLCGGIVHVASQRCETFARIHNARWLGRGGSKGFGQEVFRHEVWSRSKFGGGRVGGELVQGRGVATHPEAAEPTESEG